MVLRCLEGRYARSVDGVYGTTARGELLTRRVSTWSAHQSGVTAEGGKLFHGQTLRCSYGPVIRTSKQKQENCMLQKAKRAPAHGPHEAPV